MKKILTTLCIAATASAAFAQGYINWSTPASGITVQTNTAVSTQFGGLGTGGVIGSTPIANGNVPASVYYFALLYQAWGGSITTDRTLWDGTWSASGLTATNSNVTASRLIGNPAGNQTVPWANGTTMNIVLAGWSSSLGTSWAAVSSTLAAIYAAPGENTIAGFFGMSNFGYINPSLLTPGAAAFGTGAATANGLPIFSLSTQLYALPVPEPATFALAGLGGLALLAIRRRK